MNTRTTARLPGSTHLTGAHAGRADPVVRQTSITATRTDLALLAVATVAALLTTLAIGAIEGAPRAASAAVGIAVMTVPLAFIRRLELALYSFVPLLTLVRGDPAPVDFMAIALLVALALRRSVRPFVPPRVVLLGLALLAISQGLALAFAPSDRSFGYASTTLVVVLSGYVAYQLAARDPRVAERAFLFAGVVLTLQAVIALLPLGGASELRDGLRVEGLFNDANEFGAFAVPGVLLLLIRWPALSPVVRAAAVGILLLPVIASFSRGALLVLFVAIVALGAVAAYRRLRKVFVRCALLAATGILGLAALAAVVGPSSMATNISGVVQPYDAQRLAGQVAGLRQILTQPSLVGIGPGNYEAVLGQTSHETYLRLLVETGPLGLLGLVLVLWGAMRVIATPDLGAVAWAAALAGLAACGLFVDTIHWRQLWVVVGLALAVVAYRDRQASNGPRLAPSLITPRFEL